MSTVGAVRAGSELTEVSINGERIPETAIAAESALHEDSPDPRRAAATALVLRRLIIGRARSRGLLTRDAQEPADEDLDDALDALLALEAPVPEPTEAELERFYARNRSLFHVGERVHAAHILLAVRSVRVADALRDRAQAVLERCLEDPEHFAAAARELSNCPSGARGGDLGWLRPGECVPEFDRVIFAARAAGLWPRPVPTRFGWHVLRILQRDEGRPLPFDSARTQVAAYVRGQSRRKAGVQYLQRLAADASIRGLELHLAPGWLTQ